MIINIAYPDNGTQKKFEYKDEKQYAKLYDYKIGDEVSGDIFGEGFDGCIFRVTGGSDKDGFGMKNGVLTKTKKKLLLGPNTSGYRSKREGTSMRKTVRGAIIGGNIASINLILLQKGEKELTDLTDVKVSRRLGPKRANKIRKLFNLPRHSDFRGQQSHDKIKVHNIDVQRAVVKRMTKEIGDKKYYKAPRITRLLTTKRIRRKTVKRSQNILRIKANQEAHKQFDKLMAEKKKKQHEKEEAARKQSMHSSKSKTKKR